MTFWYIASNAGFTQPLMRSLIMLKLCEGLQIDYSNLIYITNLALWKRISCERYNIFYSVLVRSLQESVPV
jgi:hypothetical protein